MGKSTEKNPYLLSINLMTGGPKLGSDREALSRAYRPDIILEASRFFFMPRNEMAEGHIEFILSVCVCVCVCVPESCPGHNLAVHDGIENNKYKS